MISAKCLSGLAPLTWVKTSPEASETSRNSTGSEPSGRPCPATLGAVSVVSARPSSMASRRGMGQLLQWYCLFLNNVFAYFLRFESVFNL
jgi:hypothetical protein